MKRQRGRGRRSNGAGNNPNRHFESNGPDVKIRGSAQQILDKYLQYARDAQSSGDRISAENYFQHAEHYARLLASMQPKQPRRDEADDADGGQDEADEGAQDAAAEDTQPNGDGRRDRRRRRDDAPAEAEADAADDPLRVIDSDEAAEERETVDAAEAIDAPDQDEAPKRPRRRRTYKPRGEAADEGGEQTADEGVMATLSRGRSSADAAPEPETGVEESASSADA